MELTKIHLVQVRTRVGPGPNQMSSPSVVRQPSSPGPYKELESGPVRFEVQAKVTGLDKDRTSATLPFGAFEEMTESRATRHLGLWDRRADPPHLRSTPRLGYRTSILQHSTSLSPALMTVTTNKKPYVVFGYGSLIWKPPPHAIKQTPGFLKGYVRRFAQKSHDHRGTPENPGRVVTLIHTEDWDRFSAKDPFPEEDIVWGVAYTIDPEHDEVVREYLDYREKDGYTVESVDVHGFEDGQEKVLIRGAITYVGKPENPSFLGSEPIENLSQRILISVGPSGPNKEYLYELAESVRRLAPESHDSHLAALEKRVRELDLTKDLETDHRQQNGNH